MKKIIVSILSLITFSTAFACAEHNSASTKKVEVIKCEDLKCVRTNIDDINKQIVDLLAKRMDYVYQAGDIKLKNKIKAAVDPERAKKVVDNAETLGKEKGLPEGYAQAIFQVIVDKAAEHEQVNMDKKVSK